MTIPYIIANESNYIEAKVGEFTWTRPKASAKAKRQSGKVSDIELQIDRAHLRHADQREPVVGITVIEHLHRALGHPR